MLFNLGGLGGREGKKSFWQERVLSSGLSPLFCQCLYPFVVEVVLKLLPSEKRERILAKKGKHLLMREKKTVSVLRRFFVLLFPALYSCLLIVVVDIYLSVNLIVDHQNLISRSRKAAHEFMKFIGTYSQEEMDKVGIKK